MTSDRPIVRKQSKRRIPRPSMIVYQYSLLSLTQHFSRSQKKVYLLIHCREGLAGKVAFVTLTPRVVFSLLCFTTNDWPNCKTLKTLVQHQTGVKNLRGFFSVFVLPWRTNLQNKGTCLVCSEKFTFWSILRVPTVTLKKPLVKPTCLLRVRL